MSAKARALDGLKFGKWSVLRRAGTRKHFALWRCACDCGLERDVRSDLLVSGRSQSCGCLAREKSRGRMVGVTGEKHAKWNGGRFVADGYIRVYQSPGHYEAEHRLVAERVIGRRLSVDEVVHHVNGITHDNRPENLKVMTRSEHAREHDFGGRQTEQKP